MALSVAKIGSRCTMSGARAQSLAAGFTLMLAGIAAISTSSTPLYAQTQTGRVLYQQNFDDQIPGDIPKNWRYAWGTQGDDMFLISNERSVTGHNSLVLDRLTGENESNWGFGIKMPAVQNGWTVVSFCLLIQGAGTDAVFTTEIRDAQSSAEETVNIGFNKKKALLSVKGARKPVTIGQLPTDAWVRLTIWLPTPGGKQTQVWAQMEKQIEGKWQLAGKPVTLSGKVSDQPYETLRFSTWPNKRDYRAFVDDFTVSASATAPQSSGS